LLEGALSRLPNAVRLAFLGYFLVWSFLVAAALMSACGVTAHAILPLFGSAAADKIAYGLLHGALGVLLVRLGGYKLFEKVMGAAIVLMFVTVVVTAVRVAPDAARIWRGLLVPAIPPVPGAAAWTAALLGGVGGTLTVLCYGYWIREEGRDGISDLPACRLDLGLGYAMTALFGIAMVIVGSTVEVAGSGAGLVVALADRLEASLGAGARWTFLAGAWAAVVSSLLGVWQSVPYLFADQWRLLGREGGAGSVDTAGRPYRLFLYALAGVPVIGLAAGFAAMQKIYAFVGAAFMPMLAAALVVLLGPARWVGEGSRNRWWSNAVLVAVLVFFAVLFWGVLA
jgi:Mn2+/Fe2+ NRAMP family transporter